MLRYIAYSFIICVLLGVGYYAHTLTGQDLIIQAVTTSDAANSGVPATEIFSGRYQCASDSGCSHTTLLKLHDDTTMEISSQTDAGEVLLGKGTWGVGRNGVLIFLVQPTPEGSSSTAGFSLIAKKATTLNISDFSSKKNLYPWMSNPNFRRTAE